MTPATAACQGKATFSRNGSREARKTLAILTANAATPIAAAAVSRPVNSVSASTMPASNRRGVPTARRSANSSIRSPTVARPTLRMPATPMSRTRPAMPRKT